jgi:hypothetical protein
MSRDRRGRAGQPGGDGEWYQHGGVPYAWLPAPATPGGRDRRAEVARSVRENLPGAVWMAIKVVYVAVAVPLILLFAVASVGAMIWGRGW